ncbi:transcription factor bHLH162-like [Tasmannia lanceolata]|uniref:transcription factor bHLH162-like n=1 Tax=Tasmannia lanceolata TaxID=3420 RepID=UPI004063957A
MENFTASSKMDRKTVERIRRIHMKNLYSKLNSLIPSQSSKEVAQLPNQLDEAANYIKRLEEKIEKMKERKECLMGVGKENKNMNKGKMIRLSPHIKIQDLGYALTVVLISGLDNHFIFYEAIRIIEKEGAEVVNASYSVVGDKVFHTIHSQVPESRLGFQASWISGRLKDLVHELANAP